MYAPGTWVLELVATGPPVDPADLARALSTQFDRVVLERPNPEAPRICRVAVRAAAPFSLAHARHTRWTGAWHLGIPLLDTFQVLPNFAFQKGLRYDARLAMRDLSRDLLRRGLHKDGLRVIGPIVLLATSLRPSTTFGSLSDVLVHVEAMRDTDVLTRGYVEAAGEPR